MATFFKQRIRDPLNRVLTCIHPSYHISRMINDHARQRVYSGPFKGMLYIGGSVGSQYYPKILGTYEKELHQVIERLAGKTFDTIINVGAGEGYYAVGLAMRYPGFFGLFQPQSQLPGYDGCRRGGEPAPRSSCDPGTAGSACSGGVA